MVLGPPSIEGGAIVADHARAAQGTRAGRMLLTPAGGLIARLTVTFE